MSRLDRRGRDPEPGDLRGLETADVANKTIVPNRPTGVFRTPNQDIALNRAYQRFGRSKVMQQFVNRYMNEGGTSPLFGKNPKITGGNLPGLSLSQFSSIINGSGPNFNFMRLVNVIDSENFAIGDLVRVISNGLDINSSVKDIIEGGSGDIDITLQEAYTIDYGPGFMKKTGSPPPPTLIEGTFIEIIDNAGTVQIRTPSNFTDFDNGDIITVNSDDSVYVGTIGEIAGGISNVRINTNIPYIADSGPGTYSKEI